MESPCRLINQRSIPNQKNKQIIGSFYKPSYPIEVQHLKIWKILKLLQQKFQKCAHYKTFQTIDFCYYW